MSQCTKDALACFNALCSASREFSYKCNEKYLDCITANRVDERRRGRVREDGLSQGLRGILARGRHGISRRNDKSHNDAASWLYDPKDTPNRQSQRANQFRVSTRRCNRSATGVARKRWAAT